MKKKLRPSYPNSKAKLTSHEQSLVNFLNDQHWRVTVIPPSLVPGVKTPDFLINDRPWEAKTLFKSRRQTVEHAFKSALKQAPNVIFDLRFLSVPDDSGVINKILREFELNKNIKQLVIVTKDEHLILRNK